MTCLQSAIQKSLQHHAISALQTLPQEEKEQNLSLLNLLYLIIFINIFSDEHTSIRSQLYYGTDKQILSENLYRYKTTALFC